MGFTTGFLRSTNPSPSVPPPWLSGIRCAGPEDSLGACRRSDFGEVSTCGAIQRLFCYSNGPPLVLKLHGLDTLSLQPLALGMLGRWEFVSG